MLHRTRHLFIRQQTSVISRSGAGHRCHDATQYDEMGYGVAIPTEEVVAFLTACEKGDTQVVSFPLLSERFEDFKK